MREMRIFGLSVNNEEKKYPFALVRKRYQKEIRLNKQMELISKMLFLEDPVIFTTTTTSFSCFVTMGFSLELPPTSAMLLCPDFPVSPVSGKQVRSNDCLPKQKPETDCNMNVYVEVPHFWYQKTITPLCVCCCCCNVT